MSLIVVLDSLFRAIDVERAAAAERGWELVLLEDDPSALARADALAGVRTRVDASLLASAPRCRAVARFGSGLDTIDAAAAAARGIAVTGVRDYCIPELAGHTLALALALERGLTTLSRTPVAPGDWDDLLGETAGLGGDGTAVVVGYGSIGAAVAGALRALGREVVVVSSHGAQRARHDGLPVRTLEQALPDARLLTLHAALSERTHGLLGADALARLAPDCLLVNTARLGLLDEAAVAAALAGGRLAGLGLDARLAPESPLRALAGDPRVLITPHVGWFSRRSQQELRRRTIMNAIDATEAPARGAADPS